MAKRISIKSRAIGEVFAELRGDINPKTVRAISDNLPFAGTANRWGDEIYFEIPVSMGEENAIQDVAIGDVAYWPPGRAMCIFFGRTPSSTDDRPRAYSPVNVFGRIIGDAAVFKKVNDREKIHVEKAQQAEIR